jgi:hypothetical protein
LQTAECFAALNELSSAQEFLDAVRELDGYAVAVCILKTAFVDGVLMEKCREQLKIREFWRSTKFAECPLLFVEVKCLVRLADPREVHFDMLRDFSAMVAQVTEFSAQNVWDDVASVQRPVREAFRSRCRTSGFPLLDSPVSLCLNIPVAHALMLAGGSWSSYAIPVAHGRVASGLGTGSLKILYRGLNLDDHVDALGPPAQLGPDAYEDTTVIRNVATGHYCASILVSGCSFVLQHEAYYTIKLCVHRTTVRLLPKGCACVAPCVGIVE